MEKNKMIRLILVIIICIAVVVGFYMWFSWADRESEKLDNGNANYIIEGLSTYEDTDNGVSFKYPADWTKQEVQPGVVAFAHKSGTNITFAVEDLSENPVSLNEYTEAALANLDQLNLNVDLLSSGASTIGLENYPAYTIVYTTERPADATKAGFQTKAKATWVVKNNTAFIITYTGSLEKYEEYLPMGDQAMESLNLQ